MGAPKIRTQLDLEPDQGELVRDLSDDTGIPVVELARRGLVLIFRQLAPAVQSPELAERLRAYELPRRGGRG